MFPSLTISKAPFSALAKSLIRGVMGLYSVNSSLVMNIVSLAPESINVGTFLFWNFQNPLLISAVGALVVGILNDIPDCPEVVGICAKEQSVQVE